MAWSGGTFTRDNGAHTGSSVWAQDKAAGTKILASRHDTHDQDLATGINACLTKDGSNAATANLPMGGFKHTNTAEASARTEYARASQVQDAGLIRAGTTGGTSTAFTATLTPSISSYVHGMLITARIHLTNGSSPTLNLNSVGAKSLKKFDGTGALLAVESGDLPTGTEVLLMYDATSSGQFIVLSPCIYSSPRVHSAATTVVAANTTTETDLYSYTIPANYLAAGRALRLRVVGDFINNTGSAQSTTLKVYLGGSLSFSYASGSISTAATRRPWDLEVDVLGISASSQRVIGKLFGLAPSGDIAGSGTAVTPSLFHNAGHVADSTTSLVLKVTATMGAASAAMEHRATGAYLTRL